MVTCVACDTDMETTCHDVRWTYEKIYDRLLLGKGDHICWHRPYVIWHHAVVSDVSGGKIRIIEYNSKMIVAETDMPKVDCWGCCGGEFNSLYRVNYQDCYNSDYTVLRARKLLGETRYNLIERNCEHFSRWCKTGSTNSSQISVAWTSLGKLVLAIGLKAVGLLVVLGFLQYAHEAQEDTTKDRRWLEEVQNILLSVYISVITIVFVVYLLKTTCSHLATVVRDDDPNPFAKLYSYCTRSINASRFARLCCTFWCCCFSDDARASCPNRCCDCRPKLDSRIATRCFCCLFSCCFSTVRQLCCNVCQQIRCFPCTCYRRQGHLAFGLFARIFTREVVAAGGTLIVMLHEEFITNHETVVNRPSIVRTCVLIVIALVFHLVGYIIGAFIGRCAEAFCYVLCKCCCYTSASAYRNFP